MSRDYAEEDTFACRLFGVENANDKVNVFNLGCDDWINVTRIAEVLVEELSLNDVKFNYTGGDRGWAGDVPKIVLNAAKVVRKATCPVLSIRHPEHEFVMP